mmetsp:Transcript_104759/g.291750  ORF Transcript_104759/g.291750 Transcript_104759/m.291750 type:complete len:229 (+) Transcript_104759:133-819(+)
MRQSKGGRGAAGAGGREGMERGQRFEQLASNAEGLVPVTARRHVPSLHVSGGLHLHAVPLHARALLCQRAGARQPLRCHRSFGAGQHPRRGLCRGTRGGALTGARRQRHAEGMLGAVPPTQKSALELQSFVCEQGLRGGHRPGHHGQDEALAEGPEPGGTARGRRVFGRHRQAPRAGGLRGLPATGLCHLGSRHHLPRCLGGRCCLLGWRPPLHLLPAKGHHLGKRRC